MYPTYEQWKKQQQSADDKKYRAYEDTYRAYQKGQATGSYIPNLNEKDFKGWQQWRSKNRDRLDAEYAQKDIERSINSLDQNVVSRVADQYKSQWGSKYYYDMFDPEDVARANAGQMPKYLDKTYDLNDPYDQWLYQNNLPSKDTFSDMYSQGVLDFEEEQTERTKRLNGIATDWNSYNDSFNAFQTDVINVAKGVQKLKGRELTEKELGDIIESALMSGKHDALVPYYSIPKYDADKTKLELYADGLNAADYSMYDKMLEALQKGGKVDDSFFENFKESDYKKWFAGKAAFGQQNLNDAYAAALALEQAEAIGGPEAVEALKNGDIKKAEAILSAASPKSEEQKLLEDAQKAVDPYAKLQSNAGFATMSAAPVDTSSWDEGVRQGYYALTRNTDAATTMQEVEAIAMNKYFSLGMQMTDEEVATMNYLANTQGADAMVEYVETLEPVLKLRQMEQEQGWAKSDTSTTGGAILSSILSVPAQYGAGLEGLGSAILTLTGDDDPIDTMYRTDQARYRSNVRESVGEQLSPVGQFFYGAGMSILDNLARLPMGNAGLVVMAGDVMAEQTNAALQNGATSKQALAMGAASAAIEFITEKVSLDAILKPKMAGSAKQLVGEILKQMGIEGSEEMASELLGIFAEIGIMRGNSEWEQLVAENMAQGMTRQQAEAKAAGKKAGDILLAGLGGALSGGIMGGGNVMLTNYNYGRNAGASPVKAISVGTKAVAQYQKDMQEGGTVGSDTFADAILDIGALPVDDATKQEMIDVGNAIARQPKSWMPQSVAAGYRQSIANIKSLANRVRTLGAEINAKQAKVSARLTKMLDGIATAREEAAAALERGDLNAHHAAVQKAQKAMSDYRAEYSSAEAEVTALKAKQAEQESVIGEKAKAEAANLKTLVAKGATWQEQLAAVRDQLEDEEWDAMSLEEREAIIAQNEIGLGLDPDSIAQNAANAMERNDAEEYNFWQNMLDPLPSQQNDDNIMESIVNGGATNETVQAKGETNAETGRDSVSRAESVRGSVQGDGNQSREDRRKPAAVARENRRAQSAGRGEQSVTWGSQQDSDCRNAVSAFNKRNGTNLRENSIRQARNIPNYAKTFANIVKGITGRDSFFVESDINLFGGFTTGGRQYVVLTGDMALDLFNLFHENGHNLPTILNAIYAALDNGDIPGREFDAYVKNRRKNLAAKRGVSEDDIDLGSREHLRAEFACDMFGCYGAMEILETNSWGDYGISADTVPAIKNAITDTLSSGAISETDAETADREYRFLASKGAAITEAEASGKARFSENAPATPEQDAAYLDSVKRGDMETAQRMVDEAAKAAGFSERVLHGTQKFGFTVADTSLSDDKLSFFATSDIDTAKTYSSLGVKRGINDDADYDSIDEESALHEENARDKAYELAEKISAFAGYYGYADGNDIADQFNDISTDYARGLISKDDADEQMYELATELIANAYNEDLYDGQEFYEWQESEESEKLFTEVNRAISAYLNLAEFNSHAEGSGNYDLYANTDGFLVIEGNGSKWSDIKSDILPDINSEEYKKYGYRGHWDKWTTRSISKYASDNGYRGVLFKNIYDDGGRSSSALKKPADVYSFFYPQEQVKSADPVTYDDNGNVIPLSERFNPKEEDIRFSENAPTKRQSRLNDAWQLYDDGSNPIDYYDSDPKQFDIKTSNLLRGLMLRNGENVGGTLADNVMERVMDIFGHANKRHAIGLTFSSPVRIFEDATGWGGKTAEERANNVKDGNFLKNTYYEYGNVQAANRELWIADKMRPIIEATTKNGEYGAFESAVTQMLGEGIITEEQAGNAVSDGKTMIIQTEDGVFVLDKKAQLVYSSDSHSATKYDEAFRDRLKRFVQRKSVSELMPKPTQLSGVLKVERTKDSVIVKDREGNVVAEVKQGNAPNMESVTAAVTALKQFYKDAYKEISDARLENGYAPPGYIENYFPHQSRTYNGVEGFIEALTANDLPTAINGMTGQFSPGQPWNANLQSRLGTYTEFDAIRGFNRYVHGAGDTIFYTPVIQRLRQLEKALRTQGENALTAEDQTRNSALVDWLHEWANEWANKKSSFDRGAESVFGREAYSVSKMLTSMVSQASVGGSISSALSNIVSGLTGYAQLDGKYVTTEAIRTIGQMLQLLNKNGSYDGFADKIPFMQRRFSKNEDILLNDLDKFKRGSSKALYILFSAVDRFMVESVARAKYAECITGGMSQTQAIAATNDMLIKNFSDRGKGQAARAFNVKWLKPVTQFQVEVLNQMFHFRDMDRAEVEAKLYALEREYGEGIPFEELSKQALSSGGIRKLKKEVMYLVLLSLWGMVTRGLLGRDQTWNPLGMAIDAVEDFREGGLKQAGEGIMEAVIDNAPFLSTLSGGGRVPIAGNISNVTNIIESLLNGDSLTDADWVKAGTSFIPGGGQLRKTYQGIKANVEGGKYTDDGRLQYPVAEEDFWKTVLFGPSAAAPDDYEWTDALSDKETTAYKKLVAKGYDQADLYDTLLNYGGSTNAEKALSLLANRNDFTDSEIDVIAEMVGLNYSGSLEGYAEREANKYLNKKERELEDGKISQEKFDEVENVFNEYFRLLGWN